MVKIIPNEREKRAQNDCRIITSDNMPIGTHLDSGYRLGLVVGIRWAEDNPDWRKYPDEKPTEKGPYLICTKDGFVDLNVYTIGKDSQNQEEWVLCNKDDVIAWMPLPQPPKFLNQDEPTK